MHDDLDLVSRSQLCRKQIKLHFKNKQTFFKGYFSQQFKRCMVATFKISYKIFV